VIVFSSAITELSKKFSKNESPASVLAKMSHGETYRKHATIIKNLLENISPELSINKAVEELIKRGMTPLSHGATYRVVSKARKDGWVKKPPQSA
jgi:hypothetical protein